ncbi:MAG: YceI family protein [Flavobacteriales bacterium]|jgi:polyisoprenoid-binding protein YceI
MKNLRLLAPTLLIAGLAACSSPESAPATTTTPDAAAMERTYSVDPAMSAVAWSGNMIGMPGHTGTLKFTEGSFTAKDGHVTGGSFTVDMKSYALTDTGYAPDGSEKGTRAMLMGHLMSPDFFAVDSFPTAHFNITSVEGNTAKGELTVRGRTNPATVEGITLTSDSAHAMASGDLTFNRQEFGVAWKATMKDMVLSNDIKLHIELHGMPK